MKTFIFWVFVWFLFQAVFMSAATSGNDYYKAIGGALGSRECFDGNNEVLATISGIIFPLSEMNVMKGEWCWEHFSKSP